MDRIVPREAISQVQPGAVGTRAQSCVNGGEYKRDASNHKPHNRCDVFHVDRNHRNSSPSQQSSSNAGTKSERLPITRDSVRQDLRIRRRTPRSAHFPATAISCTVWLWSSSVTEGVSPFA